MASNIHKIILNKLTNSLPDYSIEYTNISKHAIRLIGVEEKEAESIWLLVTQIFCKAKLD